MDMMEVADPDAVHVVRTFIRKQLASALKAEFLTAVRISLNLQFSKEMNVLMSDPFLQ